MKAIAARSNIKQYLDEEKLRNGTLGNQILQIQHKLNEAEEERLEFQNKHDEMFNSVSALNQRIEELESHKLHLLDKLKGYGDKGGLEYIVKTQHLDNFESKPFENRVNVEKYDPQAERDAREEMAQEAHRKKKTGQVSGKSLSSSKRSGKAAAQQ